MLLCPAGCQCKMAHWHAPSLSKTPQRQFEPGGLIHKAVEHLKINLKNKQSQIAPVPTPTLIQSRYSQPMQPNIGNIISDDP